MIKYLRFLFAAFLSIIAPISKAEINSNTVSYIDYVDEANKLYKSGQYSLALEAVNKAIHLDSDNSLLYNLKGIILCRSDHANLGLEAFNKAIELNPNDLSFYSNKGMALAQLGKYDLALEVINKALELDPKNSDAQRVKRLLIQKLGN
ncbi:TPR repeat family protein [Rickettsia felis str. Pedreira]|uniref:TPR repeat family protein n=2 Tax=Rickettsia felis TaxID=42862 RepID=A0A0F3MT22_RICFI|nr:tetratricopeptide repeat protein [Rickettsia felis]AAY62026.1 TPR repeats [Rickettsia felis URRWXCal2]KJV58821.1 TPR repeat family protein [Rickettsia felis str. Pedreira]MDE8611425.1 tetratricopeptide repeat protein [Rickettsia felis]